MSGRGLRVVSVLLLVLAARVAPVRAGSDDTIAHKVRAGDTLELLAAEYYGDRNHALFIMAANRMQHPRALKPGERVRIPVSREVTTAVGDSFESLAQTYLGDPRRARVLAEFNGRAVDDSLAAGTLLSIPFTISRTAGGDEPLAAIATAYFGDAAQAAMLRGYNGLAKDTLGKGESIEIPIVHVRVRSAMLPALDPEAKARSEKQRTMQDQAREALPGARAAWRAGDYGAIKRDLTKLDPDYLDVKGAVEIGVLLGAAYVAFGDNDSAIAAFKRVLERRPKQVLDAYRFSPKVRDVWRRAGGTVDE